MSKVILYIATSQDGFIADKEGGVDWLPHAEDPKDEVGYRALMDRISTIVMGSRSYHQILGFGDWAWGGKMTYVFTSQPLKTLRRDVCFVHDDVKNFMNKIKKGDVWLLGGAELVKSFAQEGLIDECIVTIVPSVLGEGIPLILPYGDFDLAETKTVLDGIVQNKYMRKKGQ